MGGIYSCSPKKDAFINRNYQAVVTEYNVLFNGYNSLNEGVEALDNEYQDNYWEILPIERLQLSEAIILPGQESNAYFQKAEEKAVKAIQKHSMMFRNREKNPQIDEAYLLLGMARYYDQRFIPAQEAFNYILYKYPNSDKINQARVWREKVNLRLENEELAINNLKRLIKLERLQDQEYADAKATLAQAYINLQHKDSAVQELKIAATYTKKNDEKGRYNYIIGQLYLQLGIEDTAIMAFDKVIDLNRKSPRIYMINAHIQKAKLFDMRQGDKNVLLKTLTELEENRENRPYLDIIFRQIGEFYVENDSLEMAESYFNKSLRTNSSNKHLVALNYEAIGEMKFDEKAYKLAGSYYDSTLTNLDSNTKKFLSLKRKKDNLDQVISYETLVQTNDSILKLVSLGEDGRELYFEEVISKLIAKEEEEKKQKQEEEANKRRATQPDPFFRNPNAATDLSQQGESFYFYNDVTIAYGKNEFRRLWGERELTDNWRYSKTTVVPISDVVDLETKVDSHEVPKEQLYSVSYYEDQIPVRQGAIDTLVMDRNYALYQLGLLYRDKFAEYPLAIERLETLLVMQPEEKLKLPAEYNLYKLYTLLGNEKAAVYKNNIVTKYPESRYAQLLLNPNAIFENTENNPEQVYASIFKEFQDQEYESVIARCDQAVKDYHGEEIVPRFELLKASALGRLNGLRVFSEALNYIALNYPNTEEGKQAQETIDDVLPRLEMETFDESGKGDWKIVFRFNRGDDENIKLLEDRLTSILKEISYSHITFSEDVYSSQEIFVVLHGFQLKENALTVQKILNEHKKYRVNQTSFVISSPNYQIIQTHKNLDVYPLN